MGKKLVAIVGALALGLAALIGAAAPATVTAAAQTVETVNGPVKVKPGQIAIPVGEGVRIEGQRITRISKAEALRDRGKYRALSGQLQSNRECNIDESGYDSTGLYRHWHGYILVWVQWQQNADNTKVAVWPVQATSPTDSDQPISMYNWTNYVALISNGYYGGDSGTWSQYQPDIDVDVFGQDGGYQHVRSNIRWSPASAAPYIVWRAKSLDPYLAFSWVSANYPEVFGDAPSYTGCKTWWDSER